MQPRPLRQNQRQQSHQHPNLAKGKVRRKAKSPPCHLQLTRHWKLTAVRMRAAEEEEEEEPKIHDVVVDPDNDVSKERERSVSASATTRLPLSHHTGARLELRPNPRYSSSNQEVKPDTPRRKWRSRAAASNKPEEASASLKRPHSARGGSARKRGQSVAFKAGHWSPQRSLKDRLL